MQLETKELSTRSGGTTTLLYAGTVVIAQIALPDGNQGVGVAKCNPTDRYNRRVGEGIAVGRAMQDLGKAVEQTWEGRSKKKA